jgi:hypothetical protein
VERQGGVGQPREGVGQPFPALPCHPTVTGGSWMAVACSYRSCFGKKGGLEVSLAPPSVWRWTQRSKAAQPPPLDQTDKDQRWRSSVEALPRISDGAWGVGPSSNARWRRPMLHCGPRSPAMSTCLLCMPFVHFCEFSCIQIFFSSTSGTRWIININWHMWCCFTLVLGGMLMVKLGVSNHQQKPLQCPNPLEICSVIS